MMIEICPAILTSESETLDSLLTKFSGIFAHIDIDINIEGDDFEGKATVDFQRALNSIKKYTNNIFTLHLMVSDPTVFINMVEKTNLDRDNIKLVLHQESGAENFLETEFEIGVAIKAETEFNEIEYYKQFPEVQLMTIETGVQGNPFKPEILKRVEWLRANGYKGIISLDGSVNLESAPLISKSDVDRVSVGSYFSKSDDIQNSLNELNKVLNG